MQLNNLGKIYKALDELSAVEHLSETSKSTSILLKKTFIKRSDKQLLAKLSSMGLSNNLKKLVIDEVTNKDATDLLANSTQKTALSFTSLKDAIAGVTGRLKLYGTQLKTFIGSHQIVSALAGVTLAASIAYAMYDQHKKALEEQRAKAIELTNAYKEQQSAIGSSIEEYKRLSEALQGENLSIDETRSIKEQLLSVQNSLVESYGDEVRGINLVNGGYKEQLELLEGLSQNKAKEFVAANESAFKTADRELHKRRTYDLGHVVAWNDVANPITPEQKALVDYIKQYNDALHVKEYASSDDDTWRYVSMSIEGDIGTAKELMYQFSDDLRAWGKETGIDVSSILNSVSTQLTKINSNEGIKEYQKIYDEYIISSILSDDTLNEKYKQSLDAVETYNAAYDTGNKDEILKAKENLDVVRDSLKLSEAEAVKYGETFEKIFSQAQTNFFDFMEALGTDPDLKPLTDYVKEANLFQAGTGEYGGFDFTNIRYDLNDELKAAANKYRLSEEEVIKGIYGSDDVQETIISMINDGFKERMSQQLDGLSDGGNVRLNIRAEIDASKISAAGWEDFNEDTAAIFTKTISNTDFQDLKPVNPGDAVAINFTPVMVDDSGNYIGIMTEAELYKYAHDIFAGVSSDVSHLQIGEKQTGIGAAAKAKDSASKINEIYTNLYGGKDDPYELGEFFKSNSIDTDEEVQKFIKIANAVNDLSMAKSAYLQTIPQTGDSFAVILEKQKQNIDDTQSSISTLDGALGKLSTKDLTHDEVTDLIQQFPELSAYVDTTADDFGNLKDGIEAVKSQQISSLTTELQKLALQANGETKTAIYNFVNTLNQISPDSMTATIGSLEQAVSDSEKLSEDYALIDDAISSGMALTNEQILLLINRYPSLQDSIYRTTEGWRIEEQALSTLQGRVGDLESIYLNAQTMMGEMLSKGVGTRLKMLGIELEGITSIAGAYETLAKLNQTPQTFMNDDGSGIDNVYTGYNSEEVKKALMLQGWLAELEKQLENLNHTSIYDNRNTSKGDKEKEETKKTFDWMQRAFDAMEQKRSDMQKKVDDETLSYQEQISVLETLIGLDEEYIALDEKAITTYTERWAKAQEAVRAALGEEKGSAILEKINNGNLDPIESTDEFTEKQASIIQNAIDSLADLNQAEKDYADKSGEKLEHSRERYEKWTAYISSCIDKVSETISRAESRMDLKDITGEEITESDYKGLIALSKEQVSLYYDQIDALEDQMAMAEEGSAEYFNLQSRIAGCKSAIQEAERAQAEWNEAIKDIPIKRVKRYLELLGYIKEDLNNFIQEQEALGKNTTSDQFQQLIEISQQEIDKLLEQQKLLQDKLGGYRFNSDKYNETASSIQDIDNEISGLIRSQYEYNKAILQIPVERLSQMNDALNAAKNGIGDLLSGYDSAIAGVTDVIDRQIEELNTLKEAANDKFEGQIAVYQDELDLLQKQNKERQQQLEREQKLYELERANAQKSNKVIRNGETVYEADQDAVRNARAALQEDDYNKAVRDLEDHIAGLEEERDALLEGYDQEIEKLDGVKERWSQIADSIKQAADIAKAEEILGADFADKVLGGNDSALYESMKQLYSTLTGQQAQYDEQIASNERVADLMSLYVEKWQSGAVTYEQAIAGIQNIVKQMQDGFTSKEHLDGLLDLSGASDLTELLGQAQANAFESLGQMAEYFHVVKSNSDAISSYVQTWDEMKQNIKDQIEALKAAAEALQSRPVSVPSHASRDEDDEEGVRGPTDTYVHGKYVHTNDGWGNYYDKNTGEQIADPAGNLADALEKHKKHSGLASGPIGSGGSPKDEDLILRMASKNLKPNETLVKAEVGEYILTADQFRNLAYHVQQIRTPQYQPKGLDTSKLAVQNMPATQNIEFSGDIVLQGVQDPDGLAMAIKREFPMRMRQAAHKW